MNENLTLHYDYNEGAEELNSDRIKSVVPNRFTFDENRSNEVGGVNYVFSDPETEDVIRVSVRDTGLFSGSFYAKSEEEGVSRGRGYRDPSKFEPIAREILEDIF